MTKMIFYYTLVPGAKVILLIIIGKNADRI